jgi:hypothetical protein
MEVLMTIDWDWPAQLKARQVRIADLKKRIESQRIKIRWLQDKEMNATLAKRLLSIWEESLDRLQNCKHLIETRIAERAAEQNGVLPFTGDLKGSNPMKSQRCSVGIAQGLSEPVSLWRKNWLWIRCRLAK